MVTYVFVLLMCCTLSYLAQWQQGCLQTGVATGSNKRISKYYLIVVGILLILAMFRADTVGGDLVNYTKSFKNIRSGMTENYEPAYIALQFLVSRVTGNFNIFMAICSILTITPILYIIYHKYDKYLWLGILAFVPHYMVSFSAIRVSLALVCLLVAFHTINDSKRRLAFWAFALLAILFHYTSLVVVVAFLIFNRKYSYYWYVMAALAFCFLFFAGDLVYSILTPFSKRFQQYSDFQGVYAPVNILFYGAMTVLSYIYYKPLTMSDSRNIILINMMIFMLGFNVACVWAPVYGRVVQMFNLFAIFLVPEIIKCEKKKKTHILYQIAFAVFYIYIFINTLLVNSSGIVPYRFLWGE